MFQFQKYNEDPGLQQMVTRSVLWGIVLGTMSLYIELIMMSKCQQHQMSIGFVNSEPVLTSKTWKSQT